MDQALRQLVDGQEFDIIHCSAYEDEDEFQNIPLEAWTYLKQTVEIVFEK